MADASPDPDVGTLLATARRVASGWTVALWIITLALLVVLAVPALAAILQPLDDAAWELAVSLEAPVVVTLAELLDVIGGMLVMAPLMVVVAVFLAWRRRWVALVAWVLAMVASQVSSLVLKEIYDRPRPPAPLVEVTETGSFPSGQAVTAAAVVVMTLVLWGAHVSRSRALAILGVAYVLMIAASRVYLRVHWLSDVVAGLAIGGACALTAALIVDAWRTRRHRTVH